MPLPAPPRSAVEPHAIRVAKEAGPVHLISHVGALAARAVAESRFAVPVTLPLPRQEIPVVLVAGEGDLHVVLHGPARRRWWPRLLWVEIELEGLL